MHSVLYVSDRSLKLASDIENRFSSLGKDSGIIFVGVAPIPEEDGTCKSFIVTVGSRKDVPKGAVMALSRSLLQEEMDSGLSITVVPVRGVPVPFAQNNN